MRTIKLLYITVLAFLAIITLSMCDSNMSNESCNNFNEKYESKNKPYDHFFLLRNYPDEKLDIKAYKKCINELAKHQSLNKGIKSQPSWLLEGPGNIGGRINEIVVHPTNNNIMYAGNATGGVFKTTDGGGNWTPIFDDYPYMSIGEITFDPNNADIIYVGTGDPNISGHPFVGNGVYRSTNGGNSWTHLGLDQQGIVSKIVVDPTNSNIIYVATMGIPFERNNNRGLYKSIDGGSTWTQVLFLSDQAGIIDLVMNPNNPQVLFAAGWDRIRNNSESVTSGISTQIYKTIDGGLNWTVLTNGLPSVETSRIGLCMSNLDPNILYAIFVNATDFSVYDIYKTINGGASWTALSATGLDYSLGGFGWYFGQIRVNPTNNNELFVLGVDLYKSTDGGVNWFMSGPEWSTYEFHADKHDLFYIDNNTVVCATDGGLYLSSDGGNIWNDIENIPNNQFYRVTFDPNNTGYYCGGVQDNGTNYGNNQDINNWQRIFGGDGFQPLFSPDNPDYLYVEYQNGGLYAFDGIDWIDFTYGLDGSDRRCWDMPIIMSEHNSETMFTGTYRVYKHEFAPYGTWIPISPDLTLGIDNSYHVITTVEESPVDANNLYAGTSDGLVSRSTDGGNTWTDVSTGLPGRYVTSVKASRNFNNTVYVACSGYKDNENIPHIHKSTNNGSTWTDISGDLPQLAINDIYIMSGYNDNVIFVATDGGVYFTENAGVNWMRVGTGMPIIPVYDIDYNPNNSRLIAGTFARSMMSINVDSVISPTVISQTLNSNNIDLIVYPTIAIDKINVEFSDNSSIQKLSIYDLSGKQYKTNVSQNSKEIIDISQLKAGVYIISANMDGKIYSRKFIKQ